MDNCDVMTASVTQHKFISHDVVLVNAQSDTMMLNFSIFKHSIESSDPRNNNY